MIFKNNKVYDALKWVAMVAFPAVVTLLSALVDIWAIPNGVKIVATVSAFGVFLGALLQVGSVRHQKMVAGSEIAE